MGLYDDEVAAVKDSDAYREAQQAAAALTADASLAALERAVTAFAAVLAIDASLADIDEAFARWQQAAVSLGKRLRTSGGAAWDAFASKHGAFVASLDRRPGWTQRELASHGWGLRYETPASWRVVTDDMGERILITPAPDASDVLEVVLAPLGVAATLEPFAAYGLDQLRQAMPGLNVVGRRAGRLDHVDAYEVEFTFQRDGAEQRGWRIFAINGNLTYRVTFTARGAVFAERAPHAREIVATFKLLSPHV